MDVIITFDLDHISCNNKQYEINNISFDYKDTLDKLYNFLVSRGINTFTTFVRIDNQIKNLFGSYLHVLNLLPHTNLQAEIGWHPHFYYKKDNKYFPEYNTEYIIREMWEIYTSTHIVREIRSVRMGGAVMHQKVFATLERMKFTVDSSAMPGCARDDAHRKFDWGITGNTHYRPSTFDYRSAGTPCHTILEVPMTTIPIPAPYDRNIRRRYINPTIRKEIFQPAFADCCQYLPHIVVTFHPDQLMDGYEDDLYLYGMDNFANNMDFIKSELGTVTYKSLRQFHSEL